MRNRGPVPIAENMSANRVTSSSVGLVAMTTIILQLWNYRKQAETVSGNQAFSDSVENQLGQVVQIQFLKNVIAVRFHG